MEHGSLLAIIIMVVGIAAIYGRMVLATLREEGRRDDPEYSRGCLPMDDIEPNRLSLPRNYLSLPRNYRIVPYSVGSVSSVYRKFGGRKK